MSQGYHSNLGIYIEFGQNPIKQKNLHLTFPLFILLATRCAGSPKFGNTYHQKGDLIYLNILQIELRATARPKFRSMPILKYYLHSFRINKECSQFFCSCSAGSLYQIMPHLTLAALQGCENKSNTIFEIQKKKVTMAFIWQAFLFQTRAPLAHRKQEEQDSISTEHGKISNNKERGAHIKT